MTKKEKTIIILTGKNTEFTTAGKIHNLKEIQTKELIEELGKRTQSEQNFFDTLKTIPSSTILNYISTKEGFFGDIDIIQIKLKKIDDLLSNLGYGENAKAELMKKLVDKFL
ncbi:MAG: hypothetical protein HUJ87_14945 [Fusobacterium varium]|uniref:hypothetical protein n=1 Tax=Fusobacterium varium TaxID=856 RepID=UPI00242D9198|nr:hypothetical protein [Fusobacterium varium]MCF0171789.1 hypothetical protein [Fusobacterium varium]